MFQTFNEYYVNYIWCLNKSKGVYGSLCFELLPQQMWQSKKKYIDLCQHANKYKQVVMETLSWTFSGILRITYVNLTAK